MTFLNKLALNWLYRRHLIDFATYVDVREVIFGARIAEVKRDNS